MATGTVQRVRSIVTGVAGTPRYSNLYFQGPSAPDEDYVHAVNSMWTVVLGRILTGLTITVEGAITVINSSTGDIVDVGGFTNHTLTTSGGGGELPPATCGLAQFHTGKYVAGRELRGRMYLPYPNAGDMTNGAPDASYISAWSSAFDTMNMTGQANGAWCIYSPKNHLNELVSSHSIWNKYAVLRSQRD
jgi:hypothetical protein